MGLRAHVTVAIAAMGCIGAIVVACGTDAIGVEDCRQIETARCIQAPNCGIDLSAPAHRGRPGTDIDACIRYYHDECLHGLSTNADPGNVQLQACIAAINSGDCDYVKQPELSPDCTWLIPPAAVVVDASTDGDAADEAAASGDNGGGIITIDDSGTPVINL